jgi:hypothetical protein
MPFLDTLVLVCAAFLAGAVNSIAGGGTLLSFPALLWAGLDARVANATSTLALLPGSLGAAWSYSGHLRGSRSLLWRLGLPSLLGGGGGAALLLVTPTAVFERLVPYLIFFATFLFIVQEPLARRLWSRPAAAETTGGWWAAAITFQFLVALYGGYFGAGIGILMLAGLGILGVMDIHRANGLKNLLALCINGVAAVGFLVSGLVSWPEALLMAGAALAGGYGGASVAQRLGRTFVRWAVVAVGLSIGVVMLVR